MVKLTYSRTMQIFEAHRVLDCVILGSVQASIFTQATCIGYGLMTSIDD